MHRLPTLGVITCLLVILSGYLMGSTRAGEIPSSRSSGDHENLTLLARWAHGPCDAIGVQGDTLFYGDGALIQAADFSLPEAPIPLGSLQLPGYVFDIALDGNLAFVCNRLEGLRILDIADPTDMHEIGAWPTETSCGSIALSGALAYIGDWEVGIRVLDVSDPSAPALVGTAPIDGNPNDLCIRGDHLYVLDYGYGLRVIDVSDPAAPVEVGSLETGSYNFGVDVEDDLCVLTRSAETVVISVSDPTNPVVLGSHGAYSNRVALNGSLAYVAAAGQGFRILDLSDPSQPQVVSELSTPGAPRRVKFTDTRVYLGSFQAGALAVDVSDPQAPALLGSLPTASYTSCNALDDDHCFVNQPGAGFSIFDVADPTEPIRIATIDDDLVELCQQVSIVDDHLYVSCYHFGLRVLDVSDVFNPVSTDTLLWAGRYVLDFAPVGLTGYALATFGAPNGIGTLDLQTPGHPLPLSFYELDGPTPTCLDAAAGHVVVGGYSNEVTILDASNPELLTEASTIAVNIERAYDILVRDDLVIVAGGSYGVVLVSIEDPSLPIVLAQWTPSEEALVQGLALEAEYLFLAATDAGVLVLDISDPAAPEVVGYYDTGDQARYLIARDQTVYLSDHRDGLYILRNELGLMDIVGPEHTAAAAFSVHPSLSTRRFNIALHDLARDACISIHDAAGRRVRLLAVDTESTQNLAWHGTDDLGRPLPAGVYYVRLETPGATAARPILLMR